MITKELVLDSGQTGLIPNLFYKVEDADNADLIAKTNSGIVETETGIYSVKITTWNEAWFGKVIWFLNTTPIATEGFVADNSAALSAQITALTALIEALQFIPTGSGTIYTASADESLTTVEQADLYFANRLYVTEWTNASNSMKKTALIEATRILNKFAYKGTKTSPTQLHEFPRAGLYGYSETEIPKDIVYAQFEIAYALLKGRDPEQEMRGAHVTSRRYSGVGTTYDSARIPDYILCGVPSAVAWDYFYPFLDKSASGSVHIHRVS